MEYKAIALLGKPGGGKGTQAKLLADKLGFKHFSTGAVMRKMAEGGYAFSKKLDFEMDSGNLLPHWFAEYVFEDFVFKLGVDEGVVFEGTMRTKPEAPIFHEVMQWLERSYVVVVLDASDESLEKRILKRAEIEGRDDDTAEVYKHRLEEYREHTVPVIEFLESKGKVIHIDGEPSIEDIHKDIVTKIGI